MALVPSSPLFPLDLERDIFEICALSGLVSIPKLMLVAQRVKVWCAGICVLKKMKKV
jgi:hypothetical protein